MIWRCFICFVFVALTLKSLLSHINSARSHSPDFRVVCGIDGCTKEYRVYNSLWYHIRRNHHEHLESGCSESRSGRTTTTSSREAALAVCSNGWEYRSADRTVENRARQTGEAMVENGVQPSVSPQHFGTFDRTASLYSGFDNGTRTSPALPNMVDGNSNDTYTIPDVSCPIDSSASHQTEVSLLFFQYSITVSKAPTSIFVFVSPLKNKLQLDCYFLLRMTRGIIL